MPIKLQKITRKEVKNATSSLIDKLKNEVFNPAETLVIGVARGGLAAAQDIAYALDLPYVHSVQSVLYQGTKKRNTHEINNILVIDFLKFPCIILVDDLYDTGETIEAISTALYQAADQFEEGPINIVPAVVFTKHAKRNKKESILYGVKVPAKNWLEFPWDRL